MKNAVRILGTAALALTSTAALAVAGPATSTSAAGEPLVIGGVIDGPLSGGVPKAIELVATADIADLSSYGISSANNGGGSDGEEFSLPGGSLAAGDSIFIASETEGFQTFFGFAPDHTSAAASINGDDAIELFMDGAVIDTFGEIAADGTGQSWEHTDGWAKRIDGTGPDGATFVATNWTFSGPNALDGETTNATAATPYPLDSTPASIAVVNEVRFDSLDASDTSNFVELAGEPNTPLDGHSIVVLSAEFNPGGVDAAIDLDGQTLDANGLFTFGQPGSGADDESISDLFTPASVVLVAGDPPSVDDVDTDDDGAFDADPGWEFIDSVAVTDGQTDAPDFFYGAAAVLGPDGAFAPAAVRRCPHRTGSFETMPFDDLSGDTPGGENCPPPPPLTCDATPTPISAVQGSGATSPMMGNDVTIKGVVVGDFQSGGLSGGDLGGFYVQEETEDEDGDPATSEGVFVFEGFNPTVDVAEGATVAVSGQVQEFDDFGDAELPATQIASEAWIICDPAGTAPTPTGITLPVPDTYADPDGYFESVEHMLVSVPDTLYVAEFFNYGRFGHIVGALDRQFNPTATHHPDSPEAAAMAQANDRARIALDDGNSLQNPDPLMHPNGDVFSLTNSFRGGDTLDDLVGVLSYTASDGSNADYRLHLTAPATHTAANPRPAAAPDVGGELTVVGLNVLNYFNTLDEGNDAGCGPNGDMECRGADADQSPDANGLNERTRQLDKIIATLVDLDPDIAGLIEIENPRLDTPADNDPALEDIVGALNAELGAGTYDYVQTGTVGTDAIRQAFIYKPGTVGLVGDHAILDTPEFIEPNTPGHPKSRPAVAQTFEEVATGEAFTVAVNHLKSKGSGCDGQATVTPDDHPLAGSCNLTRTMAAQALADWLAGDPTGSGDPDIMILGDLNSYDHEDPIGVLKDAGYSDLIMDYQGENAYSYVFDGELGYLDYAMTNTSLTAQVAGAAAVPYNADEPSVLDYDLSFKRDAQDLIYAPDRFRASDHDPIVVGLSFAPADDVAPTVTVEQDSSQADPVTSGDDVVFDVVFSEPVTGLGADEFDVVADGVTYTASVAGSGDTYTLTIGAATGEGTITVSLPEGAAADAAGNPSEASISTDNTVAVEAVAPPTTEPPTTEPPTTEPSDLNASRFVPVAPSRILDTRNQGGEVIDESITVPIHGAVVDGESIPDRATAVVLSVIATDNAGPGFVTAYPTGSDRPEASALNIIAEGQTRSNLVTVPIGDDGSVDLYSLTSANLIADVAGYYVPVDGAVREGRFEPLTPQRLFDTRGTEGPTGSRPIDDHTIDLQVTGVGGVPAEGVGAVVINLTGVAAGEAGYLTVFPAGIAPPHASTVNLDDATAVAANLAVVPVGVDGKISVYSLNAAHALGDVTGYYTSDDAEAAEAGLYVPLYPQRLLDTRVDRAIEAQGTLAADLIRPGSPLPATAGAVVVNVGGVDAAPGYLTVWDTGANRPVASTLNFVFEPLDTRSNAAMLPLGDDGELSYYSLTGSHVITDITGYFT